MEYSILAMSMVTPSLLLLWYFHSRDIYPEPGRVVWMTFALGVLTGVPVLVFAVPMEAMLEHIHHPIAAGAYEAFVLASPGDLDQVRVPVFRDTVKLGERAKLVARLGKALAEMKTEKGVPEEVLDGVRVWESLDDKQQLGLLSGDYGQVAAVPTWAVAAVGAATRLARITIGGHRRGRISTSSR